MENILAVQFRQVYGLSTCYPANTAAHAVAELAKQKTLTVRELRIARGLGFRVVEVDRFGRPVGDVVDA